MLGRLAGCQCTKEEVGEEDSARCKDQSIQRQTSSKLSALSERLMGQSNLTMSPCLHQRPLNPTNKTQQRLAEEECS